MAEGTLTIRDRTHPVTLPFTLEIEGDTARMQGATTLDRMRYDVGAGTPDEGTLGHAVEVRAELTATRATE